MTEISEEVFIPDNFLFNNLYAQAVVAGDQLQRYTAENPGSPLIDHMLEDVVARRELFRDYGRLIGSEWVRGFVNAVDLHSQKRMSVILELEFNPTAQARQQG